MVDIEHQDFGLKFLDPASVFSLKLEVLRNTTFFKKKKRTTGKGFDSKL